MKTEVIMKRILFGEEIGQRSKSEHFSATDMVKAGNKWRKANGYNDFNLSQYLSTKSCSEFIDVLAKKYPDPLIKGRGRSSHTWVHPLLFIDIALAISPELKLEVYEWLFDNLIKYRNESGDSYKEMSAALFGNHKDPRTFHDYIGKVADFIKLKCGVKDWQSATEDQLKLRDKIHNSIKLLCNVLRDNNQAVRIGVSECTKQTAIQS